MGALNGTISYTLFHVDGDLPDPFRDQVIERLGKFAFEELSPEAEEDSATGWCVAGDLLSTAFARENVFYEPRVCFAMRTDRWSLPNHLKKALEQRRIEERKAERQVARISRAEKDQIVDDVSRSLKEQMLPSASATDVVWHPDARRVRFWSQSKGRVELFQELFEVTFEVRLIASSAWAEAVECGLDEALVGRLAEVEVSDFSGLPEVR